MRLPILSAAFAALCLALPTSAQKIHIFGGNGTRAQTSQLFFGEKVMGGMQFVYSQPKWKDSNDAMLEKLKGGLHRLGMDWWTTFNTTVEVEFGGVKVPAGCYVVGIECSKEGKFSLALLDASKAMKASAMPFPTDEKTGAMNWKPEILVPLEFQKGTAKEVVELMTMTLTLGEDLKGSYTLTWGKHVASAAIAVVPAKQ